MYLKAYITPNQPFLFVQAYDMNSATLGFEVTYDHEPTDEDVQYIFDLLDAYQDAPYVLSYGGAQTSASISEWSVSSTRQVLATHQIPAYVTTPALTTTGRNFVINTIVWLVEFDLSDSQISNASKIAFDLVDITTTEKRTLKSIELSVSDLEDACSNDIQPTHVYKSITIKDLAIDNPRTTGIWQLEVIPSEHMRLRLVSQHIIWYTITFGVNYQNPPALPIDLPSSEVFKFPDSIVPNLGSGPVTIEPPSWSSVTGPSGKDYTAEPPDPNNYTEESNSAFDGPSGESALKDGDSSKPGPKPSDDADEARNLGPETGESPTGGADEQSSGQEKAGS